LRQRSRSPASAGSGFIEARSLQLAVWTVFVAQRRPELRERARERLDALLA
jgi:hypothetical protein